MPRPHPARLAPRHSSWLRTVLACLLSGLLFAAVHCSSYLSGDDHRHLSLVASVSEDAPRHSPGESHAPERPQHDHGASCSLPALPFLAGGALQRPADPANVLLPALLSERPVAGAPHVPPDAGGTRIARTGRSTLTSVCRWRI
ncbi:hypothetical protein OG429_36495 [Streptomyces sp. NBC_00190]|uniref:hypothetical protein n=1 Tax=unclassified Streptomyces TaxID=2593676 RepID=UPI002E289611|nr:hypothetical protein [Streptomyces sp. NBC_00190]WSZ44282.1 hypothetical protein OG239_38960 [Streptomyces sp. NBC_00868]